MIIKPLTKIKVVSSPLKCTPGSLGYMICQDQYRAYNIWSRAVLFSRIGQKGKDRLEIMVLRDDIIKYDSLRMSPKSIEMLKKLELTEGVHPKLNPSDIGKKKPRYSDYADHTRYELLKHEYKDTLDMPVWEFITYITAMSALVHTIINGTSPDNINKATAVIDTDTIDNFPATAPGIQHIWLLIMNSLKADKRNKNKEYENKYRAFFEVPENRVAYMTLLRQGLTVISEGIKIHNKHLRSMERVNRENLKDIVSYYREHTGEYKDVVRRSSHMRPSGPRPEAKVKDAANKTRLRRA